MGFHPRPGVERLLADLRAVAALPLIRSRPGHGPAFLLARALAGPSTDVEHERGPCSFAFCI